MARDNLELVHGEWNFRFSQEVFEDGRPVFLKNGKPKMRRKRIPLGTPDKREAKRMAKLLRAELEEQRRLRKQALSGALKSTLGVREFAEIWLRNDKMNRSKRHIKDSKQRMRDHVYPVIGSLQVGRVAIGDLAEVRNRVEEKGLSVSSQRQVLNCLRRMFNWGISQGYLDKSPFLARHREIFPRRKKRPPVWHSRWDIWRFMRHASSPMARLAIRLIQVTGARWGEAVAIRPTDIDWAQGEIVVTDFKTGGFRRVPVPVSFLNYLKRELGRRKQQKVQSMYLISDIKHSRTVYGVSSRRLGVRWTTKDLRSSFGCQLLSDGVSIKAVQILLGHSTVNTTEDHYADLGQDSIRAELRRAYSGRKNGHENGHTGLARIM